MNTIAAWLSAALLVGSAQAADVSDPSRDGMEHELKQAQERLERSAREVADLTLRLNAQMRDDAKAWSGVAEQHVVLGLNIGSGWNDADAHTNGVRVLSVSPGGPADVAGLRAGDEIVAFNGTGLKSTAGAPANRQLLALIHGTHADSPIDIQYQRDGKTQRTQVVPKSVAAFIDEGYLEGLRGLREGLNSMAISFGTHGASGFGSAELMEMTPGLGHYFGSDQGLLVVRAPKDERLKLEDGDVVLDIDGRVPSSPSHALQILSSYRAGETMKLHVMRRQKRIELSVEVPADTARGRMLFPGFTPPAPPLPPLPPPAPDAIDG